MLEQHWTERIRRFRGWQGAVAVLGSLVCLAIASLIVVLLHRPKVTVKPTPIAQVSGEDWHYDLDFPVHNSSILEKLIQCESQGRNISRTDSDGQMILGILQFKPSTWNEMERRFSFSGDPRNPPDAIHMADLMISSGLIARWTCARSLGLTK